MFRLIHWYPLVRGGLTLYRKMARTICLIFLAIFLSINSVACHCKCDGKDYSRPWVTSDCGCTTGCEHSDYCRGYKNGPAGNDEEALCNVAAQEAGNGR